MLNAVIFCRAFDLLEHANAEVLTNIIRYYISEMYAIMIRK